MKCKTVLFLCFMLYGVIECKHFSRCQLAMELHNVHGYSLDTLPTWMCIIKHVSNYNSAHQQGLANGIFAIYQGWCGVDSYTGGCQLICSNLLDDSISDDVTCAKHIFRQHQIKDGNGYFAWKSIYLNHCNDLNKTSQYIEGCLY